MSTQQLIDIIVEVVVKAIASAGIRKTIELIPNIKSLFDRVDPEKITPKEVKEYIIKEKLMEEIVKLELKDFEVYVIPYASPDQARY